MKYISDSGERRFGFNRCDYFGISREKLEGKLKCYGLTLKSFKHIKNGRRFKFSKEDGMGSAGNVTHCIIDVKRYGKWVMVGSFGVRKDRDGKNVIIEIYKI